MSASPSADSGEIQQQFLVRISNQRSSAWDRLPRRRKRVKFRPPKHYRLGVSMSYPNGYFGEVQNLDGGDEDAMTLGRRKFWRVNIDDFE